MSLKFGDKFSVVDENFPVMYEKLGYGDSPEFLFMFNDEGNLYYKIVNSKEDTTSIHNTNESFYSRLLRAKSLIILTDLLNDGAIEPLEEV